MRLCKLTDADGYTRRGEYGETLWEVGSTVHPTGEGCGPCGPGVLHFYVSPIVAVFCNPIHAKISNPRLFECEVSESQIDGLKRWTTESVRVLRELPVPEITPKQRVEVAIRCSLLLPQSCGYVYWAHRWLDGVDRSEAAALMAWEESEVAAAWAAWASESAASEAAWASEEVAMVAKSAARADEFEATLVRILKNVQ